MEGLERRLEHPSSEARTLRGGPSPLGAGPGEVPGHSPSPYSPECVEVEFYELRVDGVLGSSGARTKKGRKLLLRPFGLALLEWLRPANRFLANYNLGAACARFLPGVNDALVDAQTWLGRVALVAVCDVDHVEAPTALDHIGVVGVLVGAHEVVCAPGEYLVGLAVADTLEDFVGVFGPVAGFAIALDDLLVGESRAGQQGHHHHQGQTHHQLAHLPPPLLCVGPRPPFCVDRKTAYSCVKRGYVLHSTKKTPNFVLTEFSEVRELGFLRSWKVVTLGAHQAPHHPNHQLHGSLLVQALLPYERIPRLEVEREPYSSQQRLILLALRIPALGHGIAPRSLPVLEDGVGELGAKGVHLRVPEDIGEYLLVVPIVGVDLR